MNLLIDINHPGHVHLFRNAARIWLARGHKVVFTIRDREIVPDLLDACGFGYEIASRVRTGLAGMVIELIEHDWNVLRATIKHKADLLLGTSVSTCHVSKVTRAKSILFDEDDGYYQKEFAYLSRPFADVIVSPDVLKDRPTKRHVRYKGYHELAYLHPHQFTPDPSILDELGVAQGEPYFILRLVALKAHHDLGHKGLNPAARSRLVEMLSKRGQVFITIEGDIPEALRAYQMPISPHRIHHALHYAAMLISDSQTMTIEAAVLGTPAIRCNTFVGLCSVIEELEHKYGLTYGFLPSAEKEMFDKIEQLLADSHLKTTWQRKRDAMLAEKIDLTAWMVDFVEGYPGTFNTYRHK